MEGYFYAMLKEQMQQQNVSAEKLSEGICSPSLVSRFKRGERTPDKMMHDRLIGRLGISNEWNKNFLFYDDYIKWRERKAILDSIGRREIGKARKLLVEYAKSEDLANSIEQQFCHAMEAQLMMYENADRAELADKLEVVVKLTVPHIDEKAVTDLQLSAQELNLILEYEKYKHPYQLMERCDEILHYIGRSAFDNETRAKIYPKVVWYQCEMLSKELDMDCQRIIKYSNQGIQYLRAAHKTYYLWELLSIREDVFKAWAERLLSDGEAKRADALCRMRRENREWKEAIGIVYERCGAAPQMENFCYLYGQQEIYCINEMIRCRRKMLGMTRKQLGEGICDEQTIMRLENQGSKMRMSLVKQLFEKLNLSGQRSG